ncbi:MAG: hypothetical protein SWZ49_29155 [Cyanobacteriota bacterium]|nr:hypothetical protein [Cyanobacteriota bacterium]
MEETRPFATTEGTSLRVQHLLMGETPKTAMLHRNAMTPQDRAASPITNYQ